MRYRELHPFTQPKELAGTAYVLVRSQYPAKRKPPAVAAARGIRNYELTENGL